FTHPPPPASPLFPYTTLFRSGPVHVLVTNASTQFELFHGEIHRDLSKVVPGTDLFEFPSQAFKANLLGFDVGADIPVRLEKDGVDRKSTRLNSSHVAISYAVF